MERETLEISDLMLMNDLMVAAVNLEFTINKLKERLTEIELEIEALERKCTLSKTIINQ